jgi:hypothetical protein
VKSVVCQSFDFIVVVAAPDADIERKPILRSYEVRLLLKLSPFLAPVVDVKPGSLSMASEQRQKVRSIRFHAQRNLNGRNGSHALLIHRRAACEHNEGNGPPHAVSLSCIEIASMSAFHPFQTFRPGSAFDPLRTFVPVSTMAG